ncbi:hypothetical protein PROFUN_09324 [Planoprotostelium fungivorum]|uniref:Uncharacterized protein n=1 Tax=Planoprotostelium fungivorum TaxID=1890364 RepID=A0A2P6NHB3_9EUKA|nr:hypothetical protein PROFUN_09324 [Planoprotostelium fungivorum]
MSEGNVDVHRPCPAVLDASCETRPFLLSESNLSDKVPKSQLIFDPVMSERLRERSNHSGQSGDTTATPSGLSKTKTSANFGRCCSFARCVDLEHIHKSIGHIVKRSEDKVTEELRRQCEEVRDTIARLASQAASDASALQCLSVLSHRLHELEARVSCVETGHVLNPPTPTTSSTASITSTTTTPKQTHHARRRRNIRDTRVEAEDLRQRMKERKKTRTCAACSEKLTRNGISTMLCNGCSADLAGIALMLIQTKKSSS